ncbi:MAG TPA: N,N-dimethylformamidase beta subunit family domain-containing protein, partial [Chloroflexota bacterium]
MPVSWSPPLWLNHQSRRPGWTSRLLLGLALAAVLPLLWAPPAAAQTNPCLSPLNRVVAENCLPGNPANDPAHPEISWDLGSVDSTAIEGFATDISVGQNQTVHFKIRTVATKYRIDIYRLGYYGGLGARLIATVPNGATLKQAQSPCLSETATGLIDCGNWDESASWAVPANAVSGVYLAKLVREDGVAGANHIPFVVREARPSQLLVQTSDTTWQAYNSYGGNSLYVNKPPAPSMSAGRAYKVSYNRPFVTREGFGQKDYLFTSEYPMIRFLEA